MSFNRREFITASLSGLALGAVTSPLTAALSYGAEPKAPSDLEPSWKNQFQRALAQKPYLSGYKTTAQTEFSGQAVLSGQWPKELVGTLYRNGPAQHEIGDFRYQHWFDGDGMIQSYRFSSEGVAHHARMIETRKYQAEKAAGRALYPGFGTLPEENVPLTSPDMGNVGNISVLPHHGKLLALWEAGSAWDINPDTLETNGLHRFSEQGAGVPFSAHPRVEPDGTIWNFGYLSSANLLVFWHIDANGKVVKMGKVPSDPMGMPHDFVVTDSYLIMLIPPFHYQQVPRAASFLESHEWQPEQATRVLVVDKNDFSKHRWLELPSQWVFHFGNAFEDKDGIVYFDAARANDPTIMTDNFVSVMRGELEPRVSSQHFQYRLDTKRWSITEQPVLPDTLDTEFPVIDPRISTKAYRRIVLMTSDNKTQADHQSLNQVSRFDFESAKLESYTYPDSQIPEEHLFVPAPGSKPESRGWVVGTAHDWQQQKTVINVFDFEAIDAGPIASATLPYVMPLGLHGKFVAS